MRKLICMIDHDRSRGGHGLSSTAPPPPPVFHQDAWRAHRTLPHTFWLRPILKVESRKHAHREGGHWRCVDRSSDLLLPCCCPGVHTIDNHVSHPKAKAVGHARIQQRRTLQVPLKAPVESTIVCSTERVIASLQAAEMSGA